MINHFQNSYFLGYATFDNFSKTSNPAKKGVRRLEVSCSVVHSKNCIFFLFVFLEKPSTCNVLVNSNDMSNRYCKCLMSILEL